MLTGILQSCIMINDTVESHNFSLGEQQLKIISWNLKNVSANKLDNTFQPKFRSYGLGDNVLGYIVNVVMGAANQWKGVVSQTPADLFVVIELKTGGSKKGDAVSGQCVPTLTKIVNAMNTYATNAKLNYTYDAAIPLVTGQHETVGFIFNTKVLTLVKVEVEKDTVSASYLPGRTPLVATFSLVAQPLDTIRFSGIHDPPPSGAADVRMRPPIDYCVRLVNTPSANIKNTLFLGDFNCQPSDYYTKKGAKVYPFANLVPIGYGTRLPNNSLSSVRRRLDPEEMGPDAYLSAAYDNIIFWMPGTVPSDEYVPDLIGNAKNVNAMPVEALYPTNGRAVLNAYNTVSDHLPVLIEF